MTETPASQRQTAPTAEQTGLEYWARALTDERLAQDLRSLARDIRYYGREQRQAVLLEAATRLHPAAVLEEWRDSLPADHPDRPGAARAVELMRVLRRRPGT